MAFEDIFIMTRRLSEAVLPVLRTIVDAVRMEIDQKGDE